MGRQETCPFRSQAGIVVDVLAEKGWVNDLEVLQQVSVPSWLQGKVVKEVGGVRGRWWQVPAGCEWDHAPGVLVAGGVCWNCCFRQVHIGSVGLFVEIRRQP